MDEIRITSIRQDVGTQAPALPVPNENTKTLIAGYASESESESSVESGTISRTKTIGPALETSDKIDRLDKVSDRQDSVGDSGRATDVHGFPSHGTVNRDVADVAQHLHVTTSPVPGVEHPTDDLDGELEAFEADVAEDLSNLDDVTGVETATIIANEQADDAFAEAEDAREQDEQVGLESRVAMLKERLAARSAKGYAAKVSKGAIKKAKKRAIERFDALRRA